MNSTERYINENKKVLNQKYQHTYYFGIPKKAYPCTISGIVKKYIKCTVKGIYNYISEVVKHPREYLEISKYRNIKLNKSSLIIASGPSQGYLSVDYLNRIQQRGCETYVINYWSENHALKLHIPNYLVLSDPKTFNNEVDRNKEKNLRLISYLKDNPKIIILCPLKMKKIIIDNGLKNTIQCFVNSELCSLNFINPMLPRGYLSLTAYKALAWSIFQNYKIIGVIGLDNTYLKNIFCDKKNKLYINEIHAGYDDYLVDVSTQYHDFESFLSEYRMIFNNIKYFVGHNVVNLDQFSILDTFPKVKLSKFIDEI